MLVPTVMMALFGAVPVDLDLFSAFAAGALLYDGVGHLPNCDADTFIFSILLFFTLDLLASNSDGILVALLGDAVHNLTDGIAIAQAVANGHGLKVCIAIASHELPHQLADYAVLRKSGLRLRDIIKAQLLTGLTCHVGCLIASQCVLYTAHLETLKSANFLYIALTSLLPDLKQSKGKFLKTISCFIAGILVIKACNL